MHTCWIKSLCAGLSLSMTNIVAEPRLVVLFVIAKHSSAITARKQKEKRKEKCLLLIGPGSYMTHLGVTPWVVSWREKEQVSGFCFYWRQRWLRRVSWALFLLVNLKRKSRNLKQGMREKVEVPNWWVIQINRDIWNQETSVREGRLAH